MIYRISDFKYKDVINIKDGNCLGAICDVEIESEKAEVIAVVVRGRFRFFGLFGKGEEFVIAWDQVKVIGEDAVLVCFDRRPEPRRPKILRLSAKNEQYEKTRKRAKPSKKEFVF